MQLKLCPFCGELPYLEKKPLWRTYGDGTTHGYRTIYRSDEEAKQNAINTWNTRYTEEAV